MRISILRRSGEEFLHGLALTGQLGCGAAGSRARGGVCFRRRYLCLAHSNRVVPPPPCVAKRGCCSPCTRRPMIHASSDGNRAEHHRRRCPSGQASPLRHIARPSHRRARGSESARKRCSLVNARQQCGHSKFGGSRHGSQRCHVPVRVAAIISTSHDYGRWRRQRGRDSWKESSSSLRHGQC